ncbi:hypothetical protein BH23ACT3_BH23ACT3_01300 [soil metagenome]
MVGLRERRFVTTRDRHEGADVDVEQLNPGQFWLTRENQFGRTVPRYCSVITEVTRPLCGHTVTMSYAAVCDPDE